MYLLVGLGNPEQKYERTRHNVGFDAVEYAREKIGASLPRIRFHAEISQGKIGEEQILFARPLTYMNLSGVAVGEIVNFYKIPVNHVIVFCDDVAIPFGNLRLRPNGSAGGHNGLKNIIEHLGSDQFLRVRIGVGEKPAGWDLADHVLARMSDEEMVQISKTEKDAALAAEWIIKNGFDKAMNRFNTPKKKRNNDAGNTETH